MGGIAPAGAIPSRLPEPRHDALPLRACIRSRSGKNGKRQEAKGRYKPCKTGDRGSGATATDDETFHFAFQLRHRSIERLPPWIDDYGPLGTHPIKINADSFAHPSPNAVPHHSLPHSPRDGEANFRPIRLRFTDKEGCKERTCKLGSLVINLSKVFGTQQTNTFRKTSYGRLPLGADRELVASARTAPREHGPPVLRFHAGTETMRLRAMTIIRLKGAFRHCCSSL
jgi:hypothetical protein